MEIRFGLDGIDGRLLKDQAAILQAFEVHKPEVLEFFQEIHTGDPQDAEVTSGRQQGYGTLFKIGGRYDFQIVPGDQFRGSLIHRPIENGGPAESGDAIGPVGPVIGLGQGRAESDPAGVVVLDDHRCRFFQEKFQNI